MSDDTTSITRPPGDRGDAVDRPRIAAAIREILLALEEDPERDGLRDTPARVARMYAEVFAGLHADPTAHLDVMFAEEHREMIILRDIPLASFCEHHLLPFTGHAHISYIPNGRIVGLSKLARVVEGYARRPQIQERLTSAIADALLHTLRPDGVAVLIEATHTCMMLCGVQKPGATMVTSAVRGSFRERAATRAEFFALIGHTARGGARS